ncbi:hypothetical protein I7I51_00710 [Histoplasma capsulatum]|uniref:Uncharacterized protein n=1 Tax=Ajellomyces capsulatus TaxID=5037 RepID=A0A8A1MCJ7_AJECA|nr:hypothetical protein I7I51_00710 [Histoplasma capsulatum]
MAASWCLSWISRVLPFLNHILFSRNTHVLLSYGKCHKLPSAAIQLEFFHQELAGMGRQPSHPAVKQLKIDRQGTRNAVESSPERLDCYPVVLGTALSKFFLKVEEQMEEATGQPFRKALPPIMFSFFSPFRNF